MNVSLTFYLRFCVSHNWHLFIMWQTDTGACCDDVKQQVGCWSPSRTPRACSSPPPLTQPVSACCTSPCPRSLTHGARERLHCCTRPYTAAHTARALRTYSTVGKERETLIWETESTDSRAANKRHSGKKWIERPLHGTLNIWVSVEWTEQNSRFSVKFSH